MNILHFVIIFQSNKKGAEMPAVFVPPETIDHPQKGLLHYRGKGRTVNKPKWKSTYLYSANPKSVNCIGFNEREIKALKDQEARLAKAKAAATA